ncbi:tRNA pseudouridine(13) synthase TruD [Persephonella sp. KM09-Lau-8]|uniref:tRNA pseudouridine(13) synthase TruD n=1 Tax=Persephonella sp. KM09-Lau-8 TaxID=1158345 RepID=UPI0004973D17|nr:tRNA pseudouridine(13) synthase TruD [Persephonella sp. KM09-Lau-8]
MAKIINFDWNIKEKPSDFLVKEVSELEKDENGQFYLYLLIKKNMNTKDVTDRFKLSYAGLKDKNAITFQYVTSQEFLGEAIFEKNQDSFFALIYQGKVRKKLKIGQLKGNKFSIGLKGHRLKLKDWFINYYDLQRIIRNRERGKKLLKELKTGIKWKHLKWRENFYIDAYLSHLWNKAVMYVLKQKYDGFIVVEKGVKYFIPYTDYNELMSDFYKFFPILGYKVKLSPEEENIYREITQKEIPFDELMEKLSQLRIKGDYRKTFLKAEDVYITGDRINFFLPKGAYATMFLKNQEIIR